MVSGQTGSWEGRLGDLAPGDTTGAAYVTGTLWALRDAGVRFRGLDVYVESTVPMGSGLSSSAALICAVVLAEVGRAMLLDFAADRDRIAGQVDWRPDSAGLALLVADTGVRHSHASGGYGARRDECKAAAAALGVALLGEATHVHALVDPVPFLDAPASAGASVSH